MPRIHSITTCSWTHSAGRMPACRASRYSFRTRCRPTTCRASQFRGGRTNNAGQYQTDQGPFTNENVTNDVIANLTKVWGSHSSKAGLYFQHSYKPQSIFASFNSRINFTDNASNPFDTGLSYANAATGVFNSYKQANKYAHAGMELQERRVVCAGQLETEPAADTRLRTQVLLHDPAVGHDAAGLELPAGPVQHERGSETLHAGVRGRRAGRGLRSPGHRSNADCRWRHADAGQHGRRRA